MLVCGVALQSITGEYLQGTRLPRRMERKGELRQQHFSESGNQGWTLGIPFRAADDTLSAASRDQLPASHLSDIADSLFVRMDAETRGNPCAGPSSKASETTWSRDFGRSSCWIQRSEQQQQRPGRCDGGVPRRSSRRAARPSTSRN